MGEARIERGEGVRHRCAVDAVFVGQAVVLGPVGMDVAARRAAAQQTAHQAEHLLQTFVAVPPGLAGEGDVEI